MTVLQARRSDSAGLSRLGAHVVLLLGTGSAVALSLHTPWVCLALVLHGAVLAALFAGLHESVHRTAFQSRWLNDAVAGVIGFLHFLPARHFRLFHLAHHRFTQDPKRDPELARAKPATLADYLRHVSGLDHWRQRAEELWNDARGRIDGDWVPPSRRAAVAREARGHLVAYLAVAVSLAFWSAPLFYWWGPLVLAQPLLRLYLLAEHGGCPQVPDMLHNSRTTSTHRLVRFLMWNMPYHAEHHAHPGVPFHALPALHDRVRDRVRVTAEGYAAFHRAWLRDLRRARRSQASAG